MSVQLWNQTGRKLGDHDFQEIHKIIENEKVVVVVVVAVVVVNNYLFDANQSF